MSVIAPAPEVRLQYQPRRDEVARDAMVVEGHALEQVVLGGYVLGAPLGTAPVVIIVGGITASPFPFGDAATAAEPWWPSLHGADLIDPERTTLLCPCWRSSATCRIARTRSTA